MAVRIRLQRRGSKKRPVYAVVVADQRMPRDGRFLEKVGVYDPRKEADKLALELERVTHWVKQGAQPSEGLAALLKRESISLAG
ncbi:MAG: 30S ribosomal protein S16 [Magnetococcales bacterium]|nr:30S ribosomal protein S16 [Magnetococcales bacterium]